MSPASTAHDPDAAKHAERMARARAALDALGDTPPDPDDLGEPILVEGADEVLASITALEATENPVPPRPSVEDLLKGTEFEGFVAPPDPTPPVPSESFPFVTEEEAQVARAAYLARTETDEDVALEVADGAPTTLANGGVFPAGMTFTAFGDNVPEVITATTGSRIVPVGNITWRNAQDAPGPAPTTAPAATPPPPPVATAVATDEPAPRTKRKIGIVGYTGSRRLAPYGDPEWELWGLNNLHLAEDIDPSKFDAWFDLHPRTEIVKDEVHRKWLEGGSAGLPCFVWGDSSGEPPADWPNAVAYPQQHVLDSFPAYFTNSISWMTALAITLLQQRAEDQGLALSDCELGVWGVDMATDSEYAAQRPSCEFFIGIAMGLGLPVQIPESSDLLKAASLYGLETSPMLAKIEERITEITATIQAMSQAHAQHEHEARQLEANINAGRGALDQLGYLKGAWFQPTNAGNSTHESPKA